MINFIRSFVFLLVCCFLFGQFGIQNSRKREAVDGVAAVVETDVVLKSDVVQQSYMLAEKNGVDPLSSPSAFEDIYVQVLDQMINNLTLYHLSLLDTNIIVDNLLIEQTLKKEIDKRVGFAGSVSRLEELFGEPLSMIRAKLRLEIKRALRVELFTSSIYQTISPSSSDVRSFYETYKDSLPLLENRVSLSVFEWQITLGREKEASSVSFLNSLKDSVLLFGGDFYSLAEKYSDDRGSAVAGGRLGFVVRGSLFPEYEAVAFGLSKGEISAPFKTSVGYHIVLLEDRLGEKIKTSHILRRAKIEQGDVEKSRESFELFLSENLVYKYVNKFDSLCAHHNKSPGSFGGVYRSLPLSSVPPFMQKLSLDSVGFHPIVSSDGRLFLVRVFGFDPAGPVSLENYYFELESMTKSKLVSDKIEKLINKAGDFLYIENFY